MFRHEFSLFFLFAVYAVFMYAVCTCFFFLCLAGNKVHYSQLTYVYCTRFITENVSLFTVHRAKAVKTDSSIFSAHKSVARR